MTWRVFFVVMMLFAIGDTAIAADLTGVVTDPLGAPLAGARVFIHSAGPKTGPSVFCPTCYADCNRSAVSDSTGHFTISSVAPTLKFTLLAVGPDRKPMFTPKIDPDAGAATIVLEARALAGVPPQRLLRGRVLGPNGAPVIGASVAPYCLRFGTMPEDSRHEKIDPFSVTDEHGDFYLVTQDTRGSAGVVISAAGLAPKVFPDLAADGQAHSLSLTRGAFVQARLVDPQGHGLAGVKVTLTPAGDSEDASHFGDFHAETDAEGICIFSNVPAGLSGQFFAPSEGLAPRGYGLAWQTIRAGGDETTTDAGTLQVMPAHAFRGQVTLSDGKALPSGMRVVVSRPPNDGQVVDLDSQGKFTVQGVAGERLSITIRVPDYKVSWRNKDVDELNNRIFVQLQNAPLEKQLVLDPEEPTTATSTPAPPQGPMVGFVLQPDGQPAVGLTVAVATLKNAVYVGDGKVELVIGLSGKAPLHTKTDESGRFSLPRPPSPATIVVSGPQGYAELDVVPGAAVQTVTLNAWAQMTGIVKVGPTPVGGETIEASYRRQRSRYPEAPSVGFDSSATTDDNGLYKFERIPAGIIFIGRRTEIDNFWGTRAQTVCAETKARETTRMDLGGSGRAVLGKIEIPAASLGDIDWKGVSGELRQKQTEHRPPESLSDEERLAWFNAWSNSEAGRQEQLAERSYSFGIKEDGTFRIDDVAPGTYQLHGRFRRKGVERYDVMGYIGSEVELPAGDSPFEMTPLPLLLREKMFAPGEAAPALECNALDGRPIPASTWTGKVLLLHFWIAGPTTVEEQIRPLRELQQTFGSDERFTIVSLAMNDKREHLDRFLEKNPSPWQQTYLGPMNKSPVAKAFRVRGFPSIFLIGTDGKFIETIAQPDNLKAKIAKALER